MDLKVKWHCEHPTPCRLYRQYSNESYIGCSIPSKWLRSGAIRPTSENDFSPWCLIARLLVDWETTQSTLGCCSGSYLCCSMD